MTETVPPFRLYDFLAYLFPGAAALSALSMIFTELHMAATEAASKEPLSDAVLFLSVSYALGLVLSVLSRFIRLLTQIFVNPREEYYSGLTQKGRILSKELTDALQKRVHETFKCNLIDPNYAAELCRVYVAENCPVAWNQRENITAVQAMSANFIWPALLYAMDFLTRGYKLLAILCVALAIVLFLKVIMHERYEWRVIYIAFLVSTTKGSDHTTHREIGKVNEQ